MVQEVNLKARKYLIRMSSGMLTVRNRRDLRKRYPPATVPKAGTSSWDPYVQNSQMHRENSCASSGVSQCPNEEIYDDYGFVSSSVSQNDHGGIKPMLVRESPQSPRPQRRVQFQEEPDVRPIPRRSGRERKQPDRLRYDRR